jgi:DNA-binding IclR family transcriptional regulator
MASWNFLTSHARVLMCIARDPGARLRDIAASLGITERSAHGIVADLAAKMPAAVLADLLHLSPGTAVRWAHQAGGDWSRYAAELARERVHQT